MNSDLILIFSTTVSVVVYLPTSLSAPATLGNNSEKTNTYSNYAVNPPKEDQTRNEIMQIYPKVHILRHRAPVAEFAMYGLREAAKQCHISKQYDRWDCTVHHSTQYTLLDQPPIIGTGYKESAFYVALSSAGAAWAVSTACVQGQLEWCTCDTQKQNTQQSWQWGGCSYGLKFGLVTSRRLLSQKYNQHVGNKALQTMMKHNLKAGRQAVKRTARQHCRCHGVSGSCQMKTCWQMVNDLTEIGTHLHDKYESAHNIPLLPPSSHNLNHQQLQFPSPEHKASDLVYVRPAANWCAPIAHLAHAGVRGRTCNWHNGTHSYGDCVHMCCAQGYTTHQRAYTQKCNCKFVWCCRVECDFCVKKVFVSTCL